MELLRILGISWVRGPGRNLVGFPLKIACVAKLEFVRGQPRKQACI